MIRVGNDDPDKIRLIFLQRPGDLVGMIIDHLHRLFHLAAGFFADISPVVHHSGNGRHGYSGNFGHIFDTRHFMHPLTLSIEKNPQLGIVYFHNSRPYPGIQLFSYD